MKDQLCADLTTSPNPEPAGEVPEDAEGGLGGELEGGEEETGADGVVEAEGVGEGGGTGRLKMGWDRKSGAEAAGRMPSREPVGVGVGVGVGVDEVGIVEDSKTVEAEDEREEEVEGRGAEEVAEGGTGGGLEEGRRGRDLEDPRRTSSRAGEEDGCWPRIELFAGVRRWEEGFFTTTKEEWGGTEEGGEVVAGAEGAEAGGVDGEGGEGEGAAGGG